MSLCIIFGFFVFDFSGFDGSGFKVVVVVV